MSVMYAAEIHSGGHMQTLPSTAFDFGTGDFTIAAMIATTTSGTVVARRDASLSTGAGFALSVGAGGAIVFATYGPGGGAYQGASGPTEALDGHCHALIAIRHGTTLRILLDGDPLPVTVSGTATPPVDVDNALPLTIGASYNGEQSGDQFVGSVMNVGVWSAALEGSALVRATFARVRATDPALQGYWPMHASAEDLSSNDNPADIVGLVTYGACVNCVWTTGEHGYVFCQMSNSPSTEDLKQIDGTQPLTQAHSVDVQESTPVLYVSIMAPGETPAFPTGATLVVTDPHGQTYDAQTNTNTVFVAMHDNQPWALGFATPAAGHWTLSVTAPASTAFLLQMQSGPTTEIVTTVENALEPLYGVDTLLLERDRLDELGGWLKILAAIAVNTIVVVAAVALVVVSGGAAAPAVAAGIIMYAGLTIVEYPLFMAQLDRDKIDHASEQMAGASGFIVSPQTMLLLDANLTDDVTHLLYERRQQVLYPYVTASPFDKRKKSLIGSEDSRAKVSAALLGFSAGYVSLCGHGNNSVVTGWYTSGQGSHPEEILQVGDYDPDEVKGKIFHMLSCKCGYNGDEGLGRDLVHNGALAFFGYSDTVYIVESQSAVFADCDIEIDKALIDGDTCADAWTDARRLYESAISNYKTKGEDQTAATLEGNRDCLVAPSVSQVYGNPNARLDTGTQQ